MHAVDVAYNTLDYSLRVNPNIVVHERSNILEISSLEPPVQRAVADLSFRSLRKVSRHILSLCSEKYLLALCKPSLNM